MIKRKRILFLIETVDGGGAEKVLTTILHHLNNSIYDIHVIAISGGGCYENEIINLCNYSCLLNKPESYVGINKLWYWLKLHLIYFWIPMGWVYKLFIPKENDVEIAFIEGFATKLLAASTNKKAKKISWVHVDLKERPWTQKEKVFKNLEEEIASYKKYHSVICVSQSVEYVMKSYYGLVNTKTIYNPLDDNVIRKSGEELADFAIDKNKYNIVSVGRLHPQKGFDLLLPIIKKVKEKHKNIHLWIIGEGAQKESLFNQAKELQLESDITFTGFVKNPYSLIKKMNLFVCSSRAEGFSLVIAESLILGVPVISMNCSGPNELLGNNEYGILCNTYEQLYEEIIAVIEGKKIPYKVPPILNLKTTIEQIHRILDENKSE